MEDGRLPVLDPSICNDVIAELAYDVYPPGTAKIRPDSHFERTVRMLLRWLGEIPADGQDYSARVHEAVLAAIGSDGRYPTRDLWVAKGRGRVTGIKLDRPDDKPTS